MFVNKKSVRIHGNGLTKFYVYIRYLFKCIHYFIVFIVKLNLINARTILFNEQYDLFYYFKIPHYKIKNV